MKYNYSQYREDDIQRKLAIANFRPLDVMFTGVTGAGKSTTLNSVFEKTVAKVGNGVDPETMDLDSYMLSDWLRLWDTPGLGDGMANDARHKARMVELLNYTYTLDGREYKFIDLAVVIIEGSRRDLGTTTALLEDVLIPNINPHRILVAINQADYAKKGRGWNDYFRLPSTDLKDYLEDFTKSIQSRIKADTGLLIPKPVYYSAEYGYNISSFLDLIIDNMPKERRRLNH